MVRGNFSGGNCPRRQLSSGAIVLEPVKLHTIRQTELFQRRYKVYVKSHRHCVVVERTSCVHVVNSDL